MSAHERDERPTGEARQAWLEACETARTKVYRGLIAMGASRSDADDALQDAFEAAVRVEVPASKPEGWLFVVAVRSWHRRRWRDRIFHPLFAARSAGPLPDREGEIDLLIELARLPERQRAVLVARHVLGLSQKETASVLGMAPGTVASTGYRAIRALRDKLGG